MRKEKEQVQGATHHSSPLISHSFTMIIGIILLIIFTTIMHFHGMMMTGWLLMPM
jgi:hypothetical protein